MKAMLKAKLREWPGSKYYLLFLFTISLLVTAPSLSGGLASDDYIHNALYSGFLEQPDDGSLLGLFSFLDGNPEKNQKLMDQGALPWWSCIICSGTAYSW